MYKWYDSKCSASGKSLQKTSINHWSYTHIPALLNLDNGRRDWLPLLLLELRKNQCEILFLT
jgi:hypothetical protein